jgi:hypothetical protein
VIPMIVAPPTGLVSRPVLDTVYAGTVLYRIHSKAYAVDAFNPEPSHKYFGGGRFDSTSDDKYSYLYAGSSIDVTIVETLLRDYPFDATGKRLLPRVKYKGRRISAVKVLNDLKVVPLRTGNELADVRQSTALVNCGPEGYAQTRHWGHWIRSQSPSAQGYVWYSRFEPGSLSYVFFGDRHMGLPMLAPFPSAPKLPSGNEADFDTLEGRLMLNQKLARYHTEVRTR